MERESSRLYMAKVSWDSRDSPSGRRVLPGAGSHGLCNNLQLFSAAPRFAPASQTLVACGGTATRVAGERMGRHTAGTRRQSPDAEQPPTQGAAWVLLVCRARRAPSSEGQTALGEKGRSSKAAGCSSVGLQRRRRGAVGRRQRPAPCPAPAAKAASAPGRISGAAPRSQAAPGTQPAGAGLGSEHRLASLGTRSTRSRCRIADLQIVFCSPCRRSSHDLCSRNRGDRSETRNALQFSNFQSSPSICPDKSQLPQP